jgi:hypothetical protein
MKLLVLGLSLSSSWGNGHATTYRALLRAFAARGHAVTFLERDVPWYAENRDLADPGWCRLELYRDLDDLGRRAGEIASADAVLVGSYVPEGVDVARLVQRTARGATAFYDIDTPVTLAKLSRGDHEYLSPEVIPGYDVYLSFTGGPVLDTLRRHYGAPAAEVLYCSADAARYRPVPGIAPALGPLLSRHLQPGPPARAGAPAARARAPRAGAPLRRRRPAIPGRHRLALQRRAAGACRPAGPSRILCCQPLDVERHPRRHGALGLEPERAALRGRGLRHARHLRRLGRAGDAVPPGGGDHAGQ